MKSEEQEAVDIEIEMLRTSSVALVQRLEKHLGEKDMLEAYTLIQMLVKQFDPSIGVLYACLKAIVMLVTENKITGEKEE